MKITRLQLCPFCGGTPYIAPSGSCGFVIRCGDCSARTVSDFGKDYVVREWNTRIKQNNEYYDFND